MPNHFAYLALFSWPLVVFYLFRALPRTDALIWSILGGYLLLPYGVGVKVPMVPNFDKVLIPSLVAGVMCLIVPEQLRRTRRPSLSPDSRRGAAAAGGRFPETAAPGGPAAVTERGSPYTRQRESDRERPSGTSMAASDGTATALPRRTRGGWLVNLLLALLLLTSFITVLQNGDPVQVGQNVLPGLRLYDAGSAISGTLVMLLPFLLGRRYLARPETHVLLLRILCLSGLLYTLPTLFEVRMSPQLSRRIYGFLAQSFDQAMRDGGFRPVVFLQHGLWLAIFLAMTSLAGFVLWRHERARGRKTRWFLAGAYLAVVLVLCHSLGAAVVLMLLAPVVLLATVRQQLIFATVVAIAMLTYPVLRGANVVPVDAIYNFVKSSVGEQRADSLHTRFQNEDELLARANLKPLAGWGGWGRSRVYDASGRDISITDGFWVITIGGSGWLGYVATVGLLTAPILLLTLRRRKLDLSLATSGLCLVLAANLIDLIPDATLTPVTWLIAGALIGRYSFGAAPEGALADASAPARRRSAGRALATARHAPQSLPEPPRGTARKPAPWP